MGLIQAFTGSLSSTLADQWRDIIEPEKFDEHTAINPGINRSTNNGRGTNSKGSKGIITEGSLIYIPENTAAFVFSEQGIETIVTEPGGYQYLGGQPSVFSGDGLAIEHLETQIVSRFTFGGIPAENKTVAYVNMREIRNIKFGTRGPQLYNDLFYGLDLQMTAFGFFSIRVIDAVKFVQNFVPPGVYHYTFSDSSAKAQLVGEFLQSFSVALNKLSDTYRISKIQSHENDIQKAIVDDMSNAGTWPDRFGISLVGVGIQNIELTEDSQRIVTQYNENKIDVSAYEDVSKRASDIAAQQKIAEGIQDNGLGEGGNLIFGMNMAQALNTNGELRQPGVSDTQNISAINDESIEVLKKLKDLLDLGIISQEEFDTKKKEILNL